MVKSLLANRKTATVLRSVPNPNKIPVARLTSTSLRGEIVRGSVETAARAHGLKVQSVSDFDWEAGIQFTPKSPGPTYRSLGGTYNTGSLDVLNLYLPGGITLKDLHDQDVLCLMLDRILHISLSVELPPGVNTYMITVQLTDLTQSVSDSIVLGVSDAVGGVVPHTLLSDGRGIVGIYTVNPYSPPRDAPPETKMRKISCSIHMSSLQDPLQTLVQEKIEGDNPLEMFMSWMQAIAEDPYWLPPTYLYMFGGFVITRL